MMLINTYFTDGYIEWAKLFVQSYRYHNGIEDPIILTAVNITKKHRSALKKLTPNINIIDRSINIKEYAERAQVTKKELLHMKYIMENKKVTNESKVWKLMVAGEDRIKSVQELLYSMNKGECLLHFDADMYITRKATALKRLVRANDFTTGFRIDKQLRKYGRVKPSKATLIYIQGFTVNDKSLKFLDTWIRYIDKLPPPKRPKGYGQSSCYSAYKEIYKKIPNFKWGDITSLKDGKGGQCWLAGNKGNKKTNRAKFARRFSEIKRNDI